MKTILTKKGWSDKDYNINLKEVKCSECQSQKYIIQSTEINLDSQALLFMICQNCGTKYTVLIKKKIHQNIDFKTLI